MQITRRQFGQTTMLGLTMVLLGERAWAAQDGDPLKILLPRHTWSEALVPLLEARSTSGRGGVVVDLVDGSPATKDLAGYDLVMVRTPSEQDALYSAGHLVGLDTLESGVDALRPLPQSAARSAGVLVGVPVVVGTPGVFARRDLLTEVGHELPESLDDLVATSYALSLAGLPGVVVSDDLATTAPLLYSFGATIAPVDGILLDGSGLAGPDASAAYQLLEQLLGAGDELRGVMRPPEEALAAVAAGDAGVALGELEMEPSVRSLAGALSAEITTCSLPAGAMGASAIDLATWSLVVPASSPRAGSAIALLGELLREGAVSTGPAPGAPGAPGAEGTIESLAEENPAWRSPSPANESARQDVIADPVGANDAIVSTVVADALAAPLLAAAAGRSASTAQSDAAETIRGALGLP